MNTETYQTTSSTTPNYNPNPYNPTPAKSKYRPYRNRPSKRQALLELLSFLILLAAGPAFLGGVFAIFLCIACFALGIIGLFAWTRRHIGLFSLLATLILAGLIVNIILRSLFVAQCLPYFYYASNDRFGGATAAGFIAPVGNNTLPSNTTVPSNTTLPIPTPVPTPTNATNNGSQVFRQSNNNNNNNGTNDDDNNDYDGDDFNNSLWCGNRIVVYVTHAILIALILPALLVALSLLKKRKPTGLPVTSTTTTTTEKRRTFVDQQ